MRSMILALSAALAFTPAAHAQVSKKAQEVINKAQQECGASFKVNQGAVSSIDLTGDGKPDEVVNFGEFECEGSGAYWCGSGGCTTTFVADGFATEMLVRSWTVVDWAGSPVILLSLHGSSCNGYGAQACIGSMFWAEGKFRSAPGGNGYGGVN